MTCGVYAIRNINNGKIYVGSSKDIEGRWQKHLSDLRRGLHSNLHLQNAWEKYKEENFSLEIILECSEEELLQEEQKCIEKTNSSDRKIGYNKSLFAGSPMKGRKHTTDSKDMMRQAKLGEKNNFYGRSHTEETKKKISDAKKGVKLSEEHKKNLLNASSFKKGEENVNAKLTKEQVLYILKEKEIFLRENKTMYGFIKLMTKKFNVSSSTITRILKGKSWRSVK